MESDGLTAFALFFMLASMGAVTFLMVYCFWRILRQPASGSFVEDGGRGADSGGADSGGAA